MFFFKNFLYFINFFVFLSFFNDNIFSCKCQNGEENELKTEKVDSTIELGKLDVGSIYLLYKEKSINPGDVRICISKDKYNDKFEIQSENKEYPIDFLYNKKKEKDGEEENYEDYIYITRLSNDCFMLFVYEKQNEKCYYYFIDEDNEKLTIKSEKFFLVENNKLNLNVENGDLNDHLLKITKLKGLIVFKDKCKLQ